LAVVDELAILRDYLAKPLALSVLLPGPVLGLLEDELNREVLRDRLRIRLRLKLFQVDINIGVAVVRKANEESLLVLEEEAQLGL